MCKLFWLISVFLCVCLTLVSFGSSFGALHCRSASDLAPVVQVPASGSHHKYEQYAEQQALRISCRAHQHSQACLTDVGC